TFAPGETRKTVTVLVNGDRLGEADEHFVLNLSNSKGAAIADGQGVGTIRDDEPRIVVDGQIVFPEGDTQTTLQVAVNLSAPSSPPVTVSSATVDGTAVAGSDYLPTSGMLVFAPGETRKVIPVTLARDRTQEAIVEAFFINLSGVSSNAVILRHGVIHIVDDDKNQGNHWGYRNQNGAASDGSESAIGPASEQGPPAPEPALTQSGPSNLAVGSRGSTGEFNPAADWSCSDQPNQAHVAAGQLRADIHAVLTPEVTDLPEIGLDGGLMDDMLAADNGLTPLTDGVPSSLAGADGLWTDTP